MASYSVLSYTTAVVILPRINTAAPPRPISTEALIFFSHRRLQLRWYAVVLRCLNGVCTSAVFLLALHEQDMPRRCSALGVRRGGGSYGVRLWEVHGLAWERVGLTGVGALPSFVFLRRCTVTYCISRAGGEQGFDGGGETFPPYELQGWERHDEFGRQISIRAAEQLGV